MNITMNRAIMMAMATIFVAVLAAVRDGQALNCEQVETTISPCREYLRDGGATPPKECCDAVKSLVSIAPSQQDRQTACECLKAAASHSDIKVDLAAKLPTDCGVPATVPISPNINCQIIS
ncbi:unnamed protein product [Cuscuta epithymum]|uniref:Bifunctional inhibitor/plant lipid transfer protein/seed storage helical domain-containing protein n=1 Tax=Cuscuta epithymum TaxID=186058 RepID=A0AAV0D499_9ASTE|nr:unnamed protein product [Cuscuta epithymum]